MIKNGSWCTPRLYKRTVRIRKDEDVVTEDDGYKMEKKKGN
jgi:hypothetical protein